MSTIEPTSISRRLLGGLVLVALLILCNMALFGWLIFRSLSAQELNRIMSQTRAEAEELAEQLASEVEDGSEDLLSAIIRRQETQTYIDRVLSKREIVAIVQIRDSDGTILFEAKETSQQFGEPIDFPEDAVPTVETRSLESETPYEVLRADSVRIESEDPYRIVVVPVGDLGSFVIGLSQPELERRVQVLRSALIRQAAPIAAFTVIVLMLAYLLILWLVRRSQSLETRAREAEQMAYVGTLASGLAHEIRSPLNSLNLNMQMLAEEADGGSVASRRRLLSITRSEITRLESLVTNFLAYARPRSLELREVRAVQLFERLREVLAGEAQSTGIELVVRDLSRGEPVNVDIDQMNQLLLNLAQNAIAATAEVPRKARIELRVESDGGDVLLAVEDNGLGMSEEEKEKVFDLFYSNRPGGTGLGLAIARRIARAHGGVLEIDSKEGSGTVVRVRLRAVRKPSAGSGMAGSELAPVSIDPSPSA